LTNNKEYDKIPGWVWGCPGNIVLVPPAHNKLIRVGTRYHPYIFSVGGWEPDTTQEDSWCGGGTLTNR